MNHRKSRIDEAVREVVNRAISSVKDPRVAGKFITVTAADVSGDLSCAKVYLSVLSGDEKEALEGMNAARGYLRSYLAKELNLRIMPSLTFLRDHSAENGAHVAGLLHKIQEKEGHETT